jgi:molecular chaperone GrpE
MNHRMARRLRRQHYMAQPASEPALPALPEPPAHDAPHVHATHAPKHPPVAEFEKTIETLRDQLVRNQAEFDNFRKRQRRDEQQRLELANQGLLEQLLPVLDNFGRALANPGESVEGLLSGLQMIQNQFGEILRQNGLEKIEALGQPFDPNKHEAVSMEVSDSVPDGQVVEVFQDGYALKGRLIRPAMVKVARHS